MKNKFSDNQFLCRYRKDVKSQFGEDGIIQKILEFIPSNELNHWCCEFGAWDGQHCSNTFNLLTNHGWSGLLIEANQKKFQDLKTTYKKNERVKLVNKFINISGKNTLDDILQKVEIPQDFDLLSIDIDGNDYHIWASLKNFHPKLVIIEFNPTIPNNIAFIQAPNPKTKHGSSLLAINELARQKDYELICVNAENAFYIKRKFFKAFGIKDNSISSLKYYNEPLQVFQLYDGTMVFHGEPSHRLIWYNLPTDFNKLQVLPRFIRRCGIPWGGNIVFRLFIKLLREYRLRAWKNVDSDPGAWKM